LIVCLFVRKSKLGCILDRPSALFLKYYRLQIITVINHMASANLVAYYLALRSLSPGSNKSEGKKGIDHSQHEENRDQTPPKEPVSNPEVTEKNDENFELFGDDEEDTAWEERIQKKADEQLALKASSGKEKPIMKSVVVLDVKPWEDTTDMQVLEAKVRAIEMEGLEWKASKLVLIGYGIKKTSNFLSRCG